MDDTNPYESPRSVVANDVSDGPTRIDRGPIKFESVNNARDVVRATRLARGVFNRMAIRRWLYPGYMVAATLYFAAKAYSCAINGELQLAQAYAALSFAFVVAAVYLVRSFSRRIRIKLLRELEAGADRNFHVDRVGIHATKATEEFVVPWDLMRHFRANAEYIVLYAPVDPSRRVFGYWYLTRRSLVEPGRWDELVALVAANVDRR